MAPLSPRRSPAAARLDPIPIAWGGLVSSIGLMAGASRDWPLRLVAAAVSFGLGGFLAAVRASGRRPTHAVGAWVAGYAIHAAFVAIARTIEAFGGRTAPTLVPGSGRDWLLAAAWAFAFALFGGVVANSWLRPAGRHPR